jgi:hypothetical protein
MNFVHVCNLDDEEVLRRIKEESNVLHTTFTYNITQIKVNWVGHILSRNSLLKHTAEGMNDRSEAKTRKNSKQLLDDLTENRRNWNLKAGAVDRTVWRTGFGGGYGPVARQTTK